MGNYRFKLSDMMPNSWLYKLRDTLKSSSTSPDSNTKNPKQQQKLEGKAHKSHHQHPVQRKSYHFTRDLCIKGSVSHSETTLSGIGYFPKVNSPRQSTNKRRTNARKFRNKKQKPPRLVSSSVSAGCSCRATLGSVWAKAEQVSLPDTESSGSETDTSSSVELPQSFDQMVSLSTSSCSCGIKSGSNDIAFDVSKSSFDPENDSSPIPTSPLKFTDMVKNVRQPDDADTDIQHSLSVKVKRELPSLATIEQLPASPKPSPVIKGFTINSPGVKLQINSNSSRVVGLSQQKKPQGEGGHQMRNVTEWSSTSSGLGNRRIRQRRMSDSFAVVKKSADPKTDFKESMVEMIKENNIKTSKDLEELLACYLTLNSDEYHDVIITVFKQIWFDIGNIS